MNPSAASNDIRRDLVALLPRLRRFALTLTGEPMSADGLVQDGCTRAIQKSHHWKGEGRLESWVYNLIRTAWDEQTRQRDIHDGPATDGTDAANGAASPAAAALLDLPGGLASSLLLVDVEGFDYTEAASILGLSPNILASRLCAARLALSSAPAGMLERRA
jgi:RNA polymerase sigma-70 factor, ECF subfamily